MFKNMTIKIQNLLMVSCLPFIYGCLGGGGGGGGTGFVGAFTGTYGDGPNNGPVEDPEILLEKGELLVEGGQQLTGCLGDACEVIVNP